MTKAVLLKFHATIFAYRFFTCFGERPDISCVGQVVMKKKQFFCIFICMEQIENSEFWQLNIYSVLQSTVILPPFYSPHLMSHSLKILVYCNFQIGKHILRLKN